MFTSRHRRTLPSLPIAAALGLALLASAPHQAQAQMKVSGEIELDELDVNTGDVKRALSTAELKEYFNAARCGCENLVRITIKYEIGSSGDANAKVKVVSGSSNCLTTEKKIDGECRVLLDTTLSKLRDQNQKQIEIEKPAAELMLRQGQDCDSAQATASSSFDVHVLTDQASNEEFASIGNITYPVDLVGPDAPVAGEGEPESGEELVKVSFSKPSESEQNLKYQILCQRVDDPEANPRKGRADTAEYDVPGTAENCLASKASVQADAGGTVIFADVDGGVSDGGLDAAPDASPTRPDAGGDGASSDGASSDGGAADALAPDAFVASGGIANLDPRFVCSGGLNGEGSFKIEGLDNGVEYRFYAISIDASRNPSAPVLLGTGTPVVEEDLWERYKRSGGKATGCALGNDTSLGGGEALGALFVAGLLLGLPLLRRRRRWPLLGLLLLAVASPARAEITVDAVDFTSPQNFAAEIKLGPYAPSIDNEFSGEGPFEKLFGDGTSLMFRGELDWQIWGGFGSIGVGIAGGYYRNSANALRDDSDGSGSPSTSNERSAGTTALNLVPISLLAVYRFDVLADRWKIPVVPFVKFGLNYTVWWIEKGNGDLAEEGGDEALGGSLGLQFNAGLALRLDIFEPTAAKNLDTDIGINHTYAFIELVYFGADGFGSEGKLDVGDTTWQAGLAFEF